MDNYVRRMLGHFLMNEAEEGADLGAVDAEQEEQDEQEDPVDDPVDGAEEQPDEEPELVISLGGEQPDEQEQEAQKAPQWVKDLRKRVREQERELRELRNKGQQQEQAKAPEVGKKPTLEDCDYDPEVFEEKLTAWHERKRQADAFVAEQEQAAKRQQDEWQAKLSGYAEQRDQLKLPDYEDAEAIAAETLSQTQQAIIISGADKPAHLIYAIGKNPSKAKELAAITDPVKFAFAVAKLETQMKVENKTKQKPSPERVVTGNAPGASAVDSTLDRLREEALKTGDMTKVIQYKKQQREKKRG